VVDDVGVVIVLEVLVVVVVAHPLAAQASQHEEKELTQDVPAFGALHAEERLLTAHFVTPAAVVRQQVTAPALPQVDLAAHRMTAPRLSRGRLFAATAASATPATHLT
jgi:hypothetical protein